ncbi:hypothetical protein HCN44_008065 [Aphidius gifuensis]|uniref:THAP-type domain-containing protein n=1 Tax=Aphidius gifuensis TaxID=684658 RepID=A0A834XNP7_APHGI|nr:uncharacterized protein LOC122857740 [Aphidius gifuensis]KAF7989391.1 hypothetical protein HCN44_008065 [Aphidius gifuensis]
MEFGIFAARRSSSRQRCCIEICRSRSDKNLNLRYHTFPKENESFVSVINSFGRVEKVDRCKAWKEACKLKQVTRSTRICSLHFSRDDYILPDVHTTRRHLKKTAIPKHNLINQEALKNCEIGKMNKTRSDQSEEENDENLEEDEEMIVPEEHDISCENEDVIDVKTEILLTDKNKEDPSLIKLTDIETTEESSKTVENIPVIPPLNQIYFAISPSFITPTVVPPKSVKDAQMQVNTDDIVPKFTRFITSDSELKVATGIESFAVLNKIAKIVKTSNDYKFEQTSSRMNTRDRIIMTSIWLKQDLSYSFLSVMFKEYSAHRCQQVISNMINVLAECLKDIGSKQVHRFNKKKQIFRVFETKIPTRLASIVDNITIVISAILNLNTSSDDDDDSDKDKDK